MYRKLTTATALSGLLITSGAFASGASQSQYVYAPVLDVQPLLRYVNVSRPREECWLETHVVPSYPNGRHSSAGPMIAGGLLGGIIGHQFGSGRGNDAMTVIGTLVGSAIASDAASRRQGYAGAATREITTERCELVEEVHQEQRIDGYLVTYEYLGRQYTMETPQPPRGDRVRLRVTVHPAGW